MEKVPCHIWNFRANFYEKVKLLIISIIVVFNFYTLSGGKVKEFNYNRTIPSQEQIEYQKMEFTGFIHFTINTFTDKEWGYGDESPQLFNPSDIDVEQWVTTAKDAGMKELILTAKHHDGFCLWPSLYTEHSIKNSPYKKGSGDIVREFVDACHKHDMKVGLYLSPWDRNHAYYAMEEYLTYYRNQLKELLSNYGEINEIWFDGANGGDGYYGGANETRKINSKEYYHWEKIFAFVKELQPNIKIFSDAGPDIHWIGNEWGEAGETFWSMLDTEKVIIGKADTGYLNRGDSSGKNWVVGQCDVSIRPGWFYHEKENDQVKTADELLDIYFKSIGRNAVLLLNIPPDKRGRIHENDINVLKEFRETIDNLLEEDLASNAALEASTVRNDDKQYSPENVLKDDDSFWAAGDTEKSAEIILTLPESRKIDTVILQEPVAYGQRISSFEIFAMKEGQWQGIAKGTTVGYKRILRINSIETNQIKLQILEANNTIAVSRIGLYNSN